MCWERREPYLRCEGRGKDEAADVVVSLVGSHAISQFYEKTKKPKN